MGKLFKIRWSLLFPLSFQSCKSKDPSTLPFTPIPLPPISILPLSPPPAAAAAESQHFRWQEERDCLIVSTVQPTSAEKKLSKKKTRKQSKSSKQRTPISTTPSPDSEGFSSDDGEATETIISTDSCSSTIDGHDRLLPTISEIAPVRGPIRRRRRRRRRRQRRIGRVKRVVGDGSAPVPEGVSPARLSRFCSIEGKVRESFAVVKRSVEPFEDFKRSMVEMILEKEMVEVGELEELLRCFLSLNSRDHHGVIVEAFAEIYQAMFSESRVIS